MADHGRSAFSKQGPHLETKRYLAELGDAMSGSDDRIGETSQGRPAKPGRPFSKSEFFRRQLSAEAIATLVKNLARERVPGHSRELDFTSWSGAYNRVPADATAIVHRDELFLLKHAVVVDPDASRAEREAARRWLARSWGSVHAWESGRVYQNFPAPDPEDWAHAYYGTNYERLLRVKARYDPGNFFRFSSRFRITSREVAHWDDDLDELPEANLPTESPRSRAQRSWYRQPARSRPTSVGRTRHAPRSGRRAAIEVASAYAVSVLDIKDGRLPDFPCRRNRKGAKLIRDHT